MLTFRWFIICIFVAIFSMLRAGNAILLPRNLSRINLVCPTIIVDPSGGGNVTTIQEAINAVPPMNQRWICIRIKEGVYREQIIIPFNKPFIYLRGAGKRKTNVVWDAHESIATSATFTCQADNIIAKSITFINSYNNPLSGSGNPMKPAVAALIQGDKSAFYRCGFIGLQDTLWDVQGRHYFQLCTIQGAVDFIFGSGQSLYERCSISVVAGVLNGSPGYITAQGRSTPSETNGFVFKDCMITGYGKTYLGRPWRPYARVIFYNTFMSNIIVPQGWDSWLSRGHEGTLTFDEVDCRGLGSDVRGRVSWVNKQSNSQLKQLTSNTYSYIDAGSWLFSS